MVRLKLVFERVRLDIRIVFERFAGIGLRAGTGLKAQIKPQDEIGERHERQQNPPFGAIHIIESFAERQHFPKSKNVKIMTATMAAKGSKGASWKVPENGS